MNHEIAFDEFSDMIKIFKEQNFKGNWNVIEKIYRETNLTKKSQKYEQLRVLSEKMEILSQIFVIVSFDFISIQQFLHQVRDSKLVQTEFKDGVLSKSINHPQIIPLLLSIDYKKEAKPFLRFFSCELISLLNLKLKNVDPALIIFE